MYTEKMNILQTASQMSKTVHISSTHGYGDCEDCGFYPYAHATLTFDDGTVLHANHDGHLGGGNWSGAASTLYLWALAKLGYQVRIDGDCDNWEAYYVRTDKGHETLLMLPENPHVIDITTETANAQHDPSNPETVYEYCSALHIPAVGTAAALTMTFGPEHYDEDTGITQALVHLLHAVSDATIERLEENDYDELDDIGEDDGDDD
jgi:hypothetical protein